MTEQAMEPEISSIRGDVFVDRILGWLTICCALAVLGLSIAKLLGHMPEGIEPGPAWLEPTRAILISIGIVGLYLCTLSAANSFRIALWLYVVRLLGLVVLWKWSLPRFSGSEFLFDIVVISYCQLRIN